MDARHYLQHGRLIGRRVPMRIGTGIGTGCGQYHSMRGRTFPPIAQRILRRALDTIRLQRLFGPFMPVPASLDMGAAANYFLP